MEFFTGLGKSLQEQATVAASKAKALADNVSEKARDVAQLAAVNANVVAQKLREDARGLSEQLQVREATEMAKNAFFRFANITTHPATRPDEHELILYGITSEFITFVRSLDYSTFRDFDERQLESMVLSAPDVDGSMRLNKWQARHAMLALESVAELDNLRYLLCPKRMTEEKFWLVYFSLAQPYLPEGCLTGELPEVDPQNLEKIPTVPGTERKAGDVMEVEGDESENDDLDKYLNDVLNEDGAESTEGEDIDDLDGYVKELAADISSDPEELESSEVEPTVDDSQQNAPQKHGPEIKPCTVDTVASPEASDEAQVSAETRK